MVPLIYSFTDELRRRHVFGKKINKELLAHVFLEDLFVISFEKVEDLPFLEEAAILKKDAFKRKVISQFSFEEAREIFEKLKQGEDKKKIFEAKFQEKGIQLPQTEQELDEFLAKPNPRVGHSSTAI